MAGSPQSARSAGSRLKPVSIDPLESVGFASKGDKKLLDHKAQEDYYNKIVQRYMQFCSHYGKELASAFASLPASASADATRNPPASLPIRSAPPARRSTPSSAAIRPPESPQSTLSRAKQIEQRVPPPSTELSTLLLSLRKLREALLATASTTPVSFSQQVHIFSIRFSILAQHPPSYFPSLHYLLDKLHSPSDPLAAAELTEFTSYLILDYACRQNDLVAAFALRARARARHGFHSELVDRVLSALVHDDWIAFWQARKGLDGYMRAVTGWAVDRVRRHALKAVGSAYLSVDVKWVVKGCAGDTEGWTWEKLAEKEGLGWEKEGDKIIIRRPKSKVNTRKLEPIKEA
ncbi:hypothetical protein VTN00DRAFT_8022 [Thermoascus crustaceus]|uniref:uncharacterized protein n=1 Tax=Thermoascus crustaceus TaxID=5088 RepID=UPI003742789F